jgi:hypothetical protein
MLRFSYEFETTSYFKTSATAIFAKPSGAESRLL